MYTFVGWATTGWIFLQGSESFILDTNYTSYVSGLEDDEQIRAVETAAMAAKRISQFLTSDTKRDTLSLKPDTNEDRPQSQVNETSRGRAKLRRMYVGNLESENNLKEISDLMGTSFINIIGHLYYDLNKIRKLTSEQISILMFMDMVMCTFWIHFKNYIPVEESFEA